MAATSSPQQMRADAKELVERARAFDQNAIAMIEQATANAAKGDATAKTFVQYVDAYIKANPVRVSAGADDLLSVLKGNNDPVTTMDALCKLPHVAAPDDIAAACVILCCHTPPLTVRRVKTLMVCLAPEHQAAFQYGLENAGRIGQVDEDEQGPTCAGHVIGIARKMQMVRAGQASPGVFGAEVGWEHT